MDTSAGITALCQQLGYATGSLTSHDGNGCPEVHWSGSTWTSDWVQSSGYGRTFSCSGTHPSCITNPPSFDLFSFLFLFLFLIFCFVHSFFFQHVLRNSAIEISTTNTTKKL